MSVTPKAPIVEPDLPHFLTRVGPDAIRLTGHRIGLEHVIDLYNDGRSAEMIAHEYDTLELATIHKLIAFYLEHRAWVDHYIAEGDAQAQRLEAEQGQHDQGPSRAELERRLEARRSTGAA